MTKVTPTSKTLGMSPDEAAAYWVARHDSAGMTPREEAEFAEWEARPGNAEAFGKAASAFNIFSLPAAETDVHLRALREAALRSKPNPHWRAWAAAACMGALVIAGAGYVNSRKPIPRIQTIASEAASSHWSTAGASASHSSITGVKYATAIGQQRQVTLTDGTKVTLNTGTELSVIYSDNKRLIDLKRGQALFEVAHNPERPFTVRTGERQVTALGTVFDVRLDGNQMRVILAKGHVLVDAQPDVHATAAVPALLQPGQELVSTRGGGQRITSIDVAKALLWKTGLVEFDDVPLSQAVAEVNRYARVPIKLAEPSVGTLRLSGTFKAADTHAFAETVAQLLPIKAAPSGAGGDVLSMAQASN